MLLSYATPPLPLTSWGVARGCVNTHPYHPTLKILGFRVLPPPGGFEDNVKVWVSLKSKRKDCRFPGSGFS